MVMEERSNTIVRARSADGSRGEGVRSRVKVQRYKVVKFAKNR